LPPKSYKTTEDQFILFKSSVIYWMGWFGLKDWELTVSHNDRHIENRATCEAELGSRMVTITLTKSKWPHKPDDKEIRMLAFHEVCECLLTPISDFAEARHPVGSLEDIRHSLIRTLENSVWVNFDCESTKS